MAFSWRSKKPKEEVLSDKEVKDLVHTFQAEIHHLEETIYGVALFFEGLSLLHAGQDAVIETYQKQFRNVIQADRDTVQQARALVEKVERDPRQAPLLKQFSIVPCRGHSDPKAMERRAGVLLDAYNRLFPGRLRSQEFTQEETFRLTEEAAGDFAALD